MNKGEDLLYHYYDESAGPFHNLSDLPPQVAEQSLNDLRHQNKGYASQRSEDYHDIRREFQLINLTLRYKFGMTSR